MIMIRKICIGFVLFLCVFHVYAQESLGRFDNYAGSSAITVNPSSLTTTFVYSDLGIMSFDVLLNNNFAYLPASDLLNYCLNTSQGWPMYQSKPGGQESYYRYFDNTKNKSLTQNFALTMPSLMHTIGGFQAVGFQARLRSSITARDLPWEIPVIATESLKDTTYHNINYVSQGANVVALQWGELGLTYAATVYEFHDTKIDVGLTARMLIGVSAVRARFDELNYMILNQDSIRGNELDATLHLAAPIDYSCPFSDMKSELYGPTAKGYGASFDIGFTYTRKRYTRRVGRVVTACESAPIPYIWRFGAALLDIGSIRFKDNVEVRHYDCDDPFVFNVDEFSSVNSVHGFFDLFDRLSGVSNSVVDATDFVVGTPAAMSFQLDANIVDNFYLATYWTHPISLWHDAATRAAQLTMVPRYETSVFGVSMPVEWYDYNYLRVGLMGRIGPLTIGSDDLLPLVGLSKLRGFNFYMALRIRLDKGDCLFSPFRDACGDKVRRR